MDTVVVDSVSSVLTKAHLNFELVVINYRKNDHGYCYYRLNAVKRLRDLGHIERTCAPLL
jgi:hypothetical protein